MYLFLSLPLQKQKSTTHSSHPKLKIKPLSFPFPLKVVITLFSPCSPFSPCYLYNLLALIYWESFSPYSPYSKIFLDMNLSLQKQKSTTHSSHPKLKKSLHLKKVFKIFSPCSPWYFAFIGIDLSRDLLTLLTLFENLPFYDPSLVGTKISYSPCSPCYQFHLVALIY